MTRKVFGGLLLCGAFCTASTEAHADQLRIVDDERSGALTMFDGSTSPILAYRYRDLLAPGVDEKYRRSCYIHPLYSIDGEALTDDFPQDHPHHRGVFWGWPVVKVRGATTQTWHPHKPALRQSFVRWTKRDGKKGSAIVIAENVWHFDDQEDVARETVTIEAHAIENGARTIDIELKLDAVGESLSLEGQPEGNKGYGGFCLRASTLMKGARLETDDGLTSGDLVNEPRAWVDLSTTSAGVAIFVHKDHPDFPVRWLARNSYAGFLNPSWPGLRSVTLEPGNPVILRYRILVHRGSATAEAFRSAYTAYMAD